MSNPQKPDSSLLNTIFHNCTQCGTCCKKYRKILLLPEEVERISKLGGHVGYDISIQQIREKGLNLAREEAKARGKVYMIHPDDKGCVFLQKRNGKHYCRIYHHRPQTCRGFKCNMADDSFLNLFAADSIHLLGQNSYGLPLE